MAKKSVDKKKKGPKGKIARAKAKLERQWGEVTKEGDAASQKRVGRSRILARRPRAGGKEQPQRQPKTEDTDNGDVLVDWNDAMFDTKNNTTATRNDDDDSSTPSEDDEEEDQDDEIVGGGVFYSKLLNTIRKKTKQNHHRHDDDDSEEEGDDGDRTMEDDEHEHAANNNNNKMLLEDDSGESDEEEDDQEGDQTNTSTLNDDNSDTLDLFGNRFSNNETLPEDETQREAFLRSLQQQTEKVAVPHVNPMLELQVSKTLLDDITSSMGVMATTDVTSSNNMSKKSWTKLAHQSFAGNRDVLKRRWEEVQSQRSTLSSLQSVLYPFVTRYADCLVTCNSKKVRTKTVPYHVVCVATLAFGSGRILYTNHLTHVFEPKHYR